MLKRLRYTLIRIGFNLYAQEARKTAVYDGGIFYAALGLTGEVGETAEHVKRILRDDNGELTPDRAAALTREIGDVLWYNAALAHEIGAQFGHIAVDNLCKLADRAERGALHGSGDKR